jgi:CspA family cold shock protein
MLSGIVARYFADKGFGFIRRDDGQPEIFVHIKQITNVDEITPGDRVQFEPEVNPRNGLLQATSVRVVG